MVLLAHLAMMVNLAKEAAPVLLGLLDHQDQQDHRERGEAQASVEHKEKLAQPDLLVKLESPDSQAEMEMMDKLDLQVNQAQADLQATLESQANLVTVAKMDHLVHQEEPVRKELED